MIKIFIGSSIHDIKAEVALEYSLKKHASQDIDITWMRQSQDSASPFYDWTVSGTGFSGFRWAVPELCNFTGRALYLDVDMLNFRDIAELYHLDMQNYAMLCKHTNGRRESSVSLFNCELMQSLLPPISVLKTIPSVSTHIFNTESPLHISASCVGEIDPRWNVYDGHDFDIDQTWLLHFTNPDTQPWHEGSSFSRTWRSHPRPELQSLWYQIYNEAIKSQ